MTKITKALKRESDDTVFERGQQRPIIVILYPHGVLGFKLKGTRREYQLSTAGCYKAAVQADIDRVRSEKAAAKKAGKKR